MKRTSTILLCLISFMITFVFSLYVKEKNVEYIENIDKTEESFDLFIHKSELSPNEVFKVLEEISFKYKATIIRTDEIVEDNEIVVYKSGLFSSDYFENLHIKLNSGRLPKTNSEYIATYNTNSSNQVGTINDIFQDNSLKFNYLPNFLKEKNISIYGKYSVTTSNQSGVMEELSSKLKIDKEKLLDLPYVKVYKLSGILFITVMLLLILILLLIMVTFFKPLLNLKMIGVLKLQGYSNFSAIKETNRNSWIAPTISMVLTIPCLFILVKNISLNFLIGWIISQFLIVIIYYFCLFISVLIIRKYKLSNIIKNYFSSKVSLYANYFFKFIIFTMLIFILPQISEGVSIVKNNLDVKDLYEEQQSFLTISSYNFVNTEFQENLNNNKTLGTKVLDLFKELEKNSEAEYFFIEKLLPIYLHIENTERFSNIHFQEQDFYYVSQANWNYIKQLELDLSGNFKQNSFNLIVPIQKKEEIDKVEGLIRPHINTYIENDKKYTNIDDIPVHIIYYSNSIEIFSNNTDLINDNRGIIKQPIFLLMDSYSLTPNSSRLLDNPISNPLKILDNEDNESNIKRAITKYDLEDNNIKFSNALESGYKAEIKEMKIGMSIFIFILVLSLIISSLSSYYISLITMIVQKREILVSRYLGYSFLDKYFILIINVWIIYGFGLIESFLLERDRVSMSIYFTLIILDFLIMIMMIRKQDKILLSTSLKGESL